jgi:hypothetical protein
MSGAEEAAVEAYLLSLPTHTVPVSATADTWSLNPTEMLLLRLRKLVLKPGVPLHMFNSIIKCFDDTGIGEINLVEFVGHSEEAYVTRLLRQMVQIPRATTVKIPLETG